MELRYLLLAMSLVAIVGFLLVLFLILKLAGIIAWSWFWVTSPLWIVALGSFSVLATCGFILNKRA